MAFSNTLVPGLRDLFYGFWLSAGIVAATLLRRPGAAIITQMLAVAVEMALNSQWSAYLLVAALAQGGLVELTFALTRYKRYDVRALMVAGAAAGLGSLAVDWLFRRPAFAGEILAIKLATRAIGGALLAGWLGNVLVNLTLATGAFDRFVAGEAVGSRVKIP
jgi:energy-coupling factor transport system substrate-specific component